MPVTDQAKRALRKDRRRTVVNLRIRRRIKQALDNAQDNPNAENLKKAASILDRAAKKKVIHQKKASRLKSQLAKKASQHQPDQQPTKVGSKKKVAPPASKKKPTPKDKS
jgi:ribosomal protein S20